MRILRWLLGKQDQSIAAVNEAPPPDNPGKNEVMPAIEPPIPDPEADNLRRWRESGQAWAWVEAQGGRWDHDAWLALLDDLKRSSFWPMHPDAVGLALEEIRREWFKR